MTSPSTLIRQAKRTKNKAEAKRLREQAATLRRNGRAAKKLTDTAGKVNVAVKNTRWQPMPGFRASIKKISPDGGTITIETGPGVNQAMQVRNRLDEAVDEIFKVTRDKKLKDSAMPVIAVRRRLVEAKAEGREEAQKEARHRADMAREMTKIAVVSGFIATADQLAKLNGGPMPQTAVISGYTLARVIDALRDAGWSENGKTSMGRHQANLDMVLGTRHEGVSANADNS